MRLVYNKDMSLPILCRLCSILLVSACVAHSPKPTDSSDVDTVPESTETEDVYTEGWTTLNDLEYDLPTDIDASMATLDVHRIDDGQTHPVALLVHGGSWVGGDKANFESSAPSFIPWWLDRGYTVVAVNFRLATPLGQPRTVGPQDQVQDIAHALAWLYAQGAALGLHGGETVAVGYSSGAHLVALLGADAGYLESVGLSRDDLAATISLDVHAYDVPFALELMVGSTVEENIPLIEHLFGDTEEEQLMGSPISHVDEDVAPALIVSVEPDPNTPGTHGYITAVTAQRYVEVLQNSGVTSDSFHDETESHASLAMGFGSSTDAVTNTVGLFIDGL